MKWIALLGFGLMGLAIMVFSASLGIRRYYLLRDSVRAQGEVVANVPSRPSEAEAGYLEVRFQSEAGETIRLRSKVDSNGLADLKEGKTVEVIYPRGHPNDAELAQFTQTWRYAIGPSAVGLTFLLFGVLAFAMVNRMNRNLNS
jgi:hypothetical protein